MLPVSYTHLDVYKRQAFDLSAIPAYSGQPYVAVNNNVPFFFDADLTDVSFESYGDLDALGRCSVAYASVGTDTMPTEKRGNIGQVKPTGWHTVKYDFVDGKYLYNRCHLIGYQLTAENANEKNLITGTKMCIRDRYTTRRRLCSIRAERAFPSSSVPSIPIIFPSSLASKGGGKMSARCV